jgi:hypothetical protein
MSNEISEQCNACFMNPPLHVKDNRSRKENGVMKECKDMLIMKNYNNTHNGHSHSNS